MSEGSIYSLMMKGQTIQLHDINWGTLNHASRSINVMYMQLCVCVCVYYKIYM